MASSLHTLLLLVTLSVRVTGYHAGEGSVKSRASCYNCRAQPVLLADCRSTEPVYTSRRHCSTPTKRMERRVAGFCWGAVC